MGETKKNNDNTCSIIRNSNKKNDNPTKKKKKRTDRFPIPSVFCVSQIEKPEPRHGGQILVQLVLALKHDVQRDHGDAQRVQD